MRWNFVRNVFKFQRISLKYLVDLNAFWQRVLNFEPFSFPYITINFFLRNALKSSENM